MGTMRPRKHDRVSHLREVHYRLSAGGVLARGHTIDLSASGVRLFCQNSPPVGEAIDLTWSDCDPPVTVGGRVIYVKVEVEGASAGVRFHQPVDPAVLQNLRTIAAAALESAESLTEYSSHAHTGRRRP